MSTEPNPPSSALRLKPRLRPAEGAATAVALDAAPPASPLPDAPTPAPAPVLFVASPAGEAAASPIRLKPKLQPAQAEAPVTATVSAPVDAFIPAAPLAPPAPPTPPPAFIPAPPPVIQVAPLVPPLVPTETPPAPADAGKFKFKPKTAGAAPVPPLLAPEPGAASVTPGAAAVGAPSPVPVPAFVPPTAPGAESPKVPAVSALSGPGRGQLPPPASVPHVKVTVQPEVVAPPISSRVAPKPPQRRGTRKVLVTLLVLVAVGAGGFYAWPRFGPALIAAVVPAAKTPQNPVAATPPPASPAASAPAPAAALAPAAPAPTPSETLNKLAHMPANAINKAQDAISARRASGQSRIDAASVGEDVSGPTFGVPPAAAIKPATPPPAPTKAPATAMTTVAPGLSATTHVEAAPEATAAFRAFVTNAKVSGVFQGTPARAVINGKLARAGDLVEEGLGIRFEGLDANRRNLVFKDKSGAAVSRRF